MSDNKLKNIANLDSLIKYLRDELDWPIENDSIEDITFDYTPEEIGISEDIAPKIKMIKQVRPFTNSQPWGIFYIEFETKRLPVVVLRRILNTLIPKKRQQNPDQKVWKLHDILFISTHGEKDNKGVSFAHFHERENENPKLMTFYWDKNETHFYYIEKLNIENLRWPKNPENSKEWQELWESAFVTEHKSVIRTSKELAVKMASMARKIRDDIFELYSAERSNGVIHKLYNRFKENLIHDLKPKDFADTYAQTIVYGLFSARIKHKNDYTIKNISNIMPKTNPFLRELFIECFSFGSKKKALIDFSDLELDDMIEAFKIAEIENIIHDFGRRTGGGKEDPVIHFYEDFMKEYDPEQKVKRGEFYTPDPVVSFIVRSVDYILKTEFEYEDGLADTEEMEVDLTIKDKKGKNKKIKERHPRVNLLDFATGTGTFLKHTILQIKSNFDEKFKSLSKEELKSKWDDYVNKHLLPRLNGFELKMAPYSIAHFNLGLTLEQTDYEFKGNSRLNVFLTNTLEKPIIKESLFDDFISVESHDAGAIKNLPITIIIGNPPYSVSSSNKTGFVTEELMSTYKQAVRDERNIQPLSDDYIKFIRYAHWKMEKINKGVIGIITNNSFIDGIIHRGMREELTKTFDEIYILNLHGNSNIGEACPDGSKDENVFDIKQGVSILFFLKTVKKKNDNAGVYYYSLQGLREKKYDVLYKNNISSIKWEKLKCETPNYWFKLKDLTHENDYNKFNKIDDIFSYTNVSGKPGDDGLLIDYDKSILYKKINEFYLKNNYADYDVKEASSNFIKNKEKILLSKDKIEKYFYRPFDIRYLYYDEIILTRPIEELHKQMKKNNLCLLVTKIVKDDLFNHVFITDIFPDVISLSSKTSTNAYSHPLYLYPDSDSIEQERVPNFTNEFKTFLKQKNLSDKFPEAILGYIYAVLYSPAYRKKYYEFLKIDFPRIPFTDDKNSFDKLSELGKNLIDLHLLKINFERSIAGFPEQKNIDFKVSKVEYQNGKVYFNETTYFDNVSDDVWHYYIGGYQVLDKWLKERKKHNSILTDNDIQHFLKVCDVLAETIKIQEKIDELTRGWI